MRIFALLFCGINVISEVCVSMSFWNVGKGLFGMKFCIGNDDDDDDEVDVDDDSDI